MQHLTKMELINLAMDNKTFMAERYAAAEELQLRKWSDKHFQAMVKWWGQGKSAEWIAEELDTEIFIVRDELRRCGLWKTRRVAG